MNAEEGLRNKFPESSHLIEACQLNPSEPALDVPLHNTPLERLESEPPMTAQRITRSGVYAVISSSSFRSFTIEDAAQKKNQHPRVRSSNAQGIYNHPSIIPG